MHTFIFSSPALSKEYEDEDDNKPLNRDLASDSTLSDGTISMLY